MHSDIANAQTLQAMIRAGSTALSGSSSPHLDARVLARYVLEETEAGLISKARENIDNVYKRKFDELILRRASGEPIAYIVGSKEFWGLTFTVTRDVLIPRSDSECMIEAVLARRDRSDALRILDLGTGSGCLLCALLSEYPAARGVGVDISPKAIEIASANAKRLGFAERSKLRVSDWFSEVDTKFDVIVANAPYIPESARAGIAIDVSEYEPEIALFAGPDGTAAYDVIFSEVAEFLRPGGLFVIEYGTAEQGIALRAMLSRILTDTKVEVFRDLAGRERGAIVQFSSQKGY